MSDHFCDFKYLNNYTQCVQLLTEQAQSDFVKIIPLDIDDKVSQYQLLLTWEIKNEIKFWLILIYLDCNNSLTSVYTNTIFPLLKPQRNMVA